MEYILARYGLEWFHRGCSSWWHRYLGGVQHHRQNHIETRHADKIDNLCSPKAAFALANTSSRTA